ncbi:MAG: hypothetical protein IJW50_03020 [Clostridia bacterium]|nr:hypothetical protein [Clostridia bacterium]
MMNDTFYATTPATGASDQHEATFTVGSTTYYLYTKKALEIDGGGDVVDKQIIAPNPALSYTEYDSIVMEAKYFIPANFNAKLEMQLLNYGCDGVASGKTYGGLFRIFGTGTKAYIEGDTNVCLNMNAWNTVSLVYNLDSGEYTVYVNGLKTAKTGTGFAKLEILSNSWIYSKVFKDYQATSSDNVLLDDVCIYEGTEPRKVTTPVYYNGFEHMTAGDTYLAASASSSQAKIKQETNGNKYWEIPVFGYDTNGNVTGWSCSNTSKHTTVTACDCGNINDNMKVDHPELSYTEYDEVILSAKYFIEKDSKTHITSQIQTVNATHVNGETETTLTGMAWLNLFTLDYEGGNYAILTNSASQNRKYYNQVVDVNRWVEISIAINLDNGAMKIYVDGNLASSATLTWSGKVSNVSYTTAAIKNITLQADQWVAYKTTNKRATMDQVKGAVYLDDVSIYRERDTLDLNDALVYEQSFDGAWKASNVLSGYPSSAAIVDAADTNHGKVLQIDCKAMGATDEYYLMYNLDNNLKLAITNGTVADGVLTGGKVTYNNVEYTVSGTINTDGRDTVLTSSADANNATLPEKVGDKAATWYIVNGQVADGIKGVGNVGAPAYARVSAQDASKLILSADYYFSTDLTKGMDLRIYSGNTAYDYLTTSVSNGKVSFNVHSGASNLATNGKNSASLGTWVNLKIVINFATDIVECYLNGELFAISYEKDFASSTAALSDNKWSLGHFLRGGKVSEYEGYCQVDNLCVEIGTATTAPCGDSVEDFTDATDATVANNFLDWGLKTPKGITSVKTEGDNKYWSFDVDYEDTASEYSNGKKGKNVDFNAILRTNDKYYSYLTSDSMVLEAKYFLSEGTTGHYQSQLRFGSATTTKHAAFTNGLDMYTIKSDGEKACVEWHRAHAATGTYANAVPVGEWFTLSMVLDLDTGVASVYIDGVLAIEGKMSNGTNHLTNLSFANDSWIVAKATTNTNAKGTIGIDDISIKPLDSTLIVDEKGNGLLSATVNGKTVNNGVKFYGTVTEKTYFNSDNKYDNSIISTYNKASIRLSTTAGAKESGLRFISQVDTEALAELFALVGDQVKSVSYGTLIAPTDYLTEGVELTMESLGAGKYLAVEATEGLYYNGDTTGLELIDGYDFVAGSIVEIKNGNLDRDFSGRGYVKVELYNGETIVFYSETSHSVDVQAQATATKAIEGYYDSLSEELKAVLDAYIAGPIVEENTEETPAA